MKLKRKYKLFIINILIIILIVIFCFSTFNYFKIIYYNKESSKENNKVIEKVMNEPINEKNTNEVKIDFIKLKEINNDIVGWIYIPKTNINYPIVQSTNNKYYLTHDINKKYNILGAIFMNSANKKDFSDNNTIIFGHNNHSKNAMFTELKKVYNGELGKDINIYIYVKDTLYIYKVYNAYIADPNDTKPLNTNTKFFSKNKDKFNYDDKEDMTLTLSTCFKNDDERIVIHAGKIIEQKN